MLTISFGKEAAEVFLAKFVADEADDLICRINSFIWLGMTMLYTGNLLLGGPITCFGSYHWSHSSYVQDYCYITGSYVIPFNEIGFSRNRTEYRHVYYYQWVAIYMFIQSCMFYCPRILWENCYKRSDVDIKSVAKYTQNISPQKTYLKEAAYAKAALTLVETAKERKHGSTSTRSNYTFYTYTVNTRILFKSLNLLNIFVVLVWLSSLLDPKDHMWSLQTFLHIFKEVKWTDSPFFPRVTFCDLSIRNLANTGTVTAQCLLGLNYYAEKILFCLNIWTVFLSCRGVQNFFNFCVVSVREK